MALEIERKFLLVDDSWRAGSDGGTAISQGYLANRPDCSVRVRVKGTAAWLTVKGGTEGIARTEFEYPVPLEDAQAMLAGLAERPFIEKVRHEVSFAGNVWEIDEFGGDNAGLTVAEIELTDAGQQFARPPWLGKEVSDDPRYLNAALVRHPFSNWK
ncbi:MAG: CYTH domain-containing protein [Pseudomonadota bacterium]